MSHTAADESRLHVIANDLLEDPIGKANHIVTLLRAVHGSMSTVGLKQTQSCAMAALRPNNDTLRQSLRALSHIWWKCVGRGSGSYTGS